MVEAITVATVAGTPWPIIVYSYTQKLHPNDVGVVGFVDDRMMVCYEGNVRVK
jgi:hypothetical protein